MTLSMYWTFQFKMSIVNVKLAFTWLTKVVNKSTHLSALRWAVLFYLFSSIYLSFIPVAIVVYRNTTCHVYIYFLILSQLIKFYFM